MMKWTGGDLPSEVAAKAKAMTTTELEGLVARLQTYECTSDFDSPSFGGPGICPACDCGVQPVEAQKRTIEALRLQVEALRKERDDWAAKWHKVRAELAELKYPGMKGEVRAALGEPTGKDLK